MPVERVPGFWDYLSQGASGAAETLRSVQRDKEERERQQLQMIQSMVSSGMMDSITANAQPVVKARGMQFAPTPQEVARRLMKQGSTTIPEINISQFISPQRSLSAMPAVGPGVTMPAGTPDERSYANLPSAGALEGDKLTAMLSGIKNRYFQTASPGQVAATQGLVTDDEVELGKRAKLDPVVTAAATRYVDQVVNAANLDFTKPEIIRKNATTLANQAFQQYVKDAGEAGNIISKSPESIAYTKAFFASEVANLVKRAEDAQLKLRLAATQSGGNQDKSIQIYNGLTATADDYQREANDLMKQFNDPTFAILNKPEAAAAQQRIGELRAAATLYRQNALKVLTGKGIDPSSFAPPPGTGASVAPSSGNNIPNLSPEEYTQAKQFMRNVPKEQQAAILEQRKNLLSTADYTKLKKELGIK